MEQIRTFEKFALALALGGAIAVAAVCFSLAFAGCSSSIDNPRAAAGGAGGGAGGAGGAGGESSSSSSSTDGAGGAGGAPVVCEPWELEDDPANWQTIKDRCVDMFMLPEPVCCNTADEQPGCISSTYVDRDCGLVWCCP